MISGGVRFRKIYDRTPKIIRNLRDGRRREPERTAQEIASNARGRVKVRSGEARDAIGHDGPEARASARHSAYLDKGTAKTRPQPYWDEAIEEARPGFEKRMGDLLKP